MFRNFFLAGFLSIIGAGSCSGPSENNPLQGLLLLALSSPPVESSHHLKDLAARRKSPFSVGAAYNRGYHLDEGKEAYASLFAAEYNLLVDEYAFEMESILPEGSSEYDFYDADKSMEFAKDHDLAVKGHALFWHGGLPAWMENSPPADMDAFVSEYTGNVIAHFAELDPGRVTTWHVVNEVIADSFGDGASYANGGTLRDSIFKERLGNNYIEQMFLEAREAAGTGVKLYINEYGIEDCGTKHAALLEAVETMLSKGIPIDGVGFQAHENIDEDYRTRLEDLECAMDAFIDLGLEVQITELDVLINNDLTGRSDEKLETQADIYYEFARACFERSECRAVLTWGVTDARSYVGENSYWLVQDEDWPLPFDEALKPKPAYESLQSAFGG